MEVNLIVEGFKFMALGMATVFVFLVIMIISMNIMSSFINKFFPEPKTVDVSPNTQEEDKKKIIAAISAAIKYHREG